MMIIINKMRGFSHYHYLYFLLKKNNNIYIYILIIIIIIIITMKMSLLCCCYYVLYFIFMDIGTRSIILRDSSMYLGLRLGAYYNFYFFI